MQKQKSQVRQYLSESFQQPTPVSSNASPHTPLGVYQGSNQGTPLTGGGGSYPQSVSQSQNSLSQHNLQHNYINNVSGYGSVATASQPSASPDAAALSPGLSSVATSTSEVSYFFFNITCFELTGLGFHKTGKYLCKLFIVYDYNSQC